MRAAPGATESTQPARAAMAAVGAATAVVGVSWFGLTAHAAPLYSRQVGIPAATAASHAATTAAVICCEGRWDCVVSCVKFQGRAAVVSGSAPRAIPLSFSADTRHAKIGSPLSGWGVTT